MTRRCPRRVISPLNGELPYQVTSKRSVYSYGATGLRFLRLTVPGAVSAGHSAWLTCAFDLEGDDLYSVKWYKNNVEFYRYLPISKPPQIKFELLGIYMDRLAPGFHRRVKAKTTFQDEDVPKDDMTTKQLFTPQEKGCKGTRDKFQDSDGILGRSTSDSSMAAALQKIDLDPEQQLYTPKIVDIAAAVMEMHGDI
ncbi:hypothetical protein LAZ67_15000734 [Cordylochernes scorpioides]|uniref:Ig-like domain-containing protein n=1 Tax=Cordylochernes scorpioides TaxID=51811 RepID=A0ABY6L8A0_9ARAC|nr:hypothetical protein LAZ67_15000734 [Cordylochernes scorpioides]